MPDADQTYLANPQVQTEPAPALPAQAPILTDPATGKTDVVPQPERMASPADGAIEHGPHGIEGMVTPVGTAGTPEGRNFDPQRNINGSVPRSDPEPTQQPAAPAIDEQALRAREQSLQQREDAFNRRRTARPLNAANLTDKSVESQIISEHAVCAFDAFADQPNITPEAERALRSTTLHVMVLRNGFPIVGTSVAAAPENYDLNTGRKEARADAMSKLWLCEEYALRNRIMGIDPVDDADRDVAEHRESIPVEQHRLAREGSPRFDRYGRADDSPVPVFGNA